MNLVNLYQEKDTLDHELPTQNNHNDSEFKIDNKNDFRTIQIDPNLNSNINLIGISNTTALNTPTNDNQLILSKDDTLDKLVSETSGNEVKKE